MSAKHDVVDGGIVESQSTGTLGSDDRQRHGRPRLPTLGFQNLFDTRQDERTNRRAVTCGPRLQPTIDCVWNLNSRAHHTILPDSWRSSPRQLRGLMSGNRMTSRIEGLFVRSITRRSIPTPSPPVGGRPYSRARM